MENITLGDPAQAPYQPPSDADLPPLPPTTGKNWVRRHPFITGWIVVGLIALIASLSGSSSTSTYDPSPSSSSSSSSDTPSRTVYPVSGGADTDPSSLSRSDQDMVLVASVRSTVGSSLGALTNGDIITLAHAMCSELDEGGSFEGIALTSIEHDFDLEVAGAISGAAVAVYCPQYADELEAFEARW